MTSGNGQADGRRAGSGRGPGVSPRLYLIVGVMLIALPLLGYVISNWFVTKKQWAEQCFEAPVWEAAAPKSAANMYRRLSLSADGKFAVTDGFNDTLRLWNLARREALKQLALREELLLAEGEHYCLALSPDGGQVLIGVGNPGSLWLWEPNTGESPRQLGNAAGEKEITALAFSPNGSRALSGDAGGTVRLWDLASGRLLKELAGQVPEIAAVAFTPDGRRAFFADGDAFCLWDLESERTVRRGARQVGDLHSLLLPDGVRVLSADMDGRILIWDLAGGAGPKEVAGRLAEGEATAVALSPDGRYFVQCTVIPNKRGFSGAMHLRETDSGRLVREFRLPRRENEKERFVPCVAFLSDGRHLLAGDRWAYREADMDWSGGGALLLWRLPDSIGYWLIGTQEE